MLVSDMRICVVIGWTIHVICGNILPDRDVWEPRAGITMWKPDYFTFSAGTDQGGYIGCAKDGLWMYSPEKDK